VRSELTALYGVAPWWAQNLFCSVEGLRLRRQRFSGEFDERLAQSRIREQWTMAQLQARRLARLRAMLVHAEQHVPYWRDVFRERGFVPARLGHVSEIEALPVTDKDLVLREGDRMRAANVPHDEVDAPVRLQTSGTTGAGMRLVMSTGALREQWAVCWRYRMWHDLAPGTWCAQLGGRLIVPIASRQPPYWRINWPGRQLMLSSYHLGPATAEQYLRALAEHDIPWIHGYPSMVTALADAAASSSVRLPSLRWVTLASESVSTVQRERIERGFGVVPREHYAQTESVANFSECPLGRLHVDEDHAHVEFVPHARNADGMQMCRVVGTSLDNWHQPFLRYDTGDLVVLDDNPCPCGRPGRIVSDIDGRREDAILLRDGTIVGRADHIFKTLEFVREAQIRQRTPGHVELHVVPRGEWTPAHEAELYASARERLGPTTTIEIHTCERIARTAGGKLRMVVREDGS
jgi:phenylacetate-CoA ligase